MPGRPRDRDPSPRRDNPASRPVRPVRPRTRLDPLPDAAPADLAPAVRRELRSLTAELADLIARHLVSAAQLLEDDPTTAYVHTQAAKSLAPRLGAVREANGIAAYHAGQYAAALPELRAARRLSGLPDLLPLIADCERGVGRPDRAIALGEEADAKRLDDPGRVELAIVISGARREQGQPEAAVLALRGPDLDRAQTQPWSVRLWYAYAEALLAAGRRDEASEWFIAAASEDDDDTTDAADRVRQLTE